jgi:hypothetical protein
MVSLAVKQRILLALFILTITLSIVSLLWIMVEQPGNLHIHRVNHTAPSKLPDDVNWSVHSTGQIQQLKSDASWGLNLCLNLTYAVGLVFFAVSAVFLWQNRKITKGQ